MKQMVTSKQIFNLNSFQSRIAVSIRKLEYLKFLDQHIYQFIYKDTKLVFIKLQITKI